MRKSADQTRQAAAPVRPGPAPLRHAFGLLAAAELGRWPAWPGPEDGGATRRRVEVLALLLDLVPRDRLDRLDDVVTEWARRFPAAEHVPPADLRMAARQTLAPGRLAPPPENENFRRAAAFARLGHAAPPARRAASADGGDDPEAERLCVFGLQVWLDQLRSKARWTHLPSVVPGDQPAPVEEVYVELFAVPDVGDGEGTGHDAHNARRASRRASAARHAVVGVPTVLARTLERCVVVGEPGSGKSTLVQWLAWATARGHLPDFDVPVVVKLSAYAQAVAERPALTPLEHFFESLGTKVDGWGPAAGRLRRAAAAHRRGLLLLDGWDEVPLALRDAVREHVTAEAEHFVTVITSRPSGLPQAFRDGARVEFYQVAGLAPRAVEELTRKLVRRQGAGAAGPILARIRSSPDLEEMAGNPFLLGLLVQVLLRDNGAGPPRTIADVYRRVVGWVREQHNAGAGPRDALTAEHVAALGRLSHGLLFDIELPTYLVKADDLEGCLARDRLPAEPVLRSRFVNRTDPVHDEYTFLHATFQEFFAAAHAGTLPQPGDQDRFLDRAFWSASRLVVLTFVAGSGGRLAERCRERAAAWLRERDLFDQVALRLARLAAAGRWPANDAGGFGRALRDELWRAVEGNEDLAATEACALALAELDPADLVRRAKRTAGLNDYAVQCVLQAVPGPVARRGGLDALLSGPWQEYAGLEAPAGVTAREIVRIRATLRAPPGDPEECHTAIVRAGAVRDEGCVPLLVRFLTTHDVEEFLLQQAVYSLGQIGGRDAVDALVGVVVDQTFSADVTQAAIEALSANDYAALDPVGRDRLVRRIAASDPRDPRLADYLSCLEGYPVRDGAAVVLDVARSGAALPEVRAAAVEVLTWVTDPAVLRELAEGVVSENSHGVMKALLVLATTRRLALPRAWLEGKITSAKDVLFRKLFLKAYCMSASAWDAADREAASAFIHALAARALNEKGEDGGSLSAGLELDADRGDVPLVGAGTVRLAADALIRFAADPATVPSQKALLAAQIAARSQADGAKSHLKAAFDAAIRFAAGGADEKTRHDRQLLATGLAGRLAEYGPGELLLYGPDCLPARAALRSAAASAGLLVFEDRVTDAEGRVVVDLRKAGPAVPASAPADLAAVMRDLPEQEANVFRSYWLMVQPGGPCRGERRLTAVYDAIERLMNAGPAGGVPEGLEACFPGRLPSLGTWRRTLTRVVDRFAGQPELLAALQRIGLGKRRRA